ncbi:MAG: hypothetical protein ACXWFT_05465 [Actinomycetota bacterium]
MQGPKKIADAGKEAGKKVLATDTAQGVVGAVADVAATVKQKAAKAGGRSTKRSTSTKSGAKGTSAKKPTAKKPTGKKSTRKKPTAKKSTAKKSRAKKR